MTVSAVPPAGIAVLDRLALQVWLGKPTLGARPARSVDVVRGLGLLPAWARAAAGGACTLQPFRTCVGEGCRAVPLLLYTACAWGQGVRQRLEGGEGHLELVRGCGCDCGCWKWSCWWASAGMLGAGRPPAATEVLPPPGAGEASRTIGSVEFARTCAPAGQRVGVGSRGLPGRHPEAAP